jgi:hypothetical protein
MAGLADLYELIEFHSLEDIASILDAAYCGELSKD